MSFISSVCVAVTCFTRLCKSRSQASWCFLTASLCSWQRMWTSGNWNIHSHRCAAHVCVCVCVCAGVFVCVCGGGERERVERECVCVYVRERERERECVCVRERDCVCVCVCAPSAFLLSRHRMWTSGNWNIHSHRCVHMCVCFGGCVCVC